MPKTIVPVQQDPFYQWLIHNTALSPSSILKYARAVRTISKEMNDRSVIFKPLGNMSSFEIDIAIASIMENTYFIDKNSRGNHMYSNALKQYRLYLNSVDEHPDCRQYEDAIKNDTSIPETQRTAIVQSRIGQGAFRKQLIEKYQGHCIITGLDHPQLLVASHIKPWAVSSNSERLQVDNGLLLSATYDRLFDSGLITFDGSGKIFLSSLLSAENVARLNLVPQTSYSLILSPQMKMHLEYHNDRIFVK